MAQIESIGNIRDDMQKRLARSFQSGNVNYLLGSGASTPAIPLAGQIEKQIARMLQDGEDEQAHDLMYKFMAGIQEPMNHMIREDVSGQLQSTLDDYINFIGSIETLLSERRTTLLPKQANVFTTNYDLLMERASINFPALRLNDGFTRTPRLDAKVKFSSRNFFNATYNTGNLYRYKVEIPCINLLKLHGSLSWKKDDDGISFKIAARELLPTERDAEQIKEFTEEYAVVLPEARKFRTTLMDRTYYDLLRIYANELDRENTLLVAFGFSFEDDHIREITKRGLKNPTLLLIIFAHSDNSRNSLETEFAGHNNVLIVAPEAEGEIDFRLFNNTLMEFLPRIGDST